jgi:selT/selW/selH-like putative selenoprotein
MPQASSVEAELRKALPDIEVELVGGHGGIFDVLADGRLVFSKRKEGRFPTGKEVLVALKG